MKILVLSCNTGGGHNACGKYIKNEFNSQNIECDVKDYLEIAGKKVSSVVEKIYLDSTKGKGNVFKNIYRIGEAYNSTNLKSPVYALNKLAKDKLSRFIEENNYNLVICTHLFPSMALTDLKKDGINFKFVNVATDYECVPFWNETNADLFVIPSVLLKDSFIKKGINEDIILSTGIPVASSFLKFNNDIDLPNDKDTILIASGSMGFGNLKKLVQKLLEKFTNVYFLIICGNNQKLADELKKIDNPNLIVKGFVNNMNEYMNKCRIIITKPGGLTTSEVATLRKPLIHMMPIPGVENYNAIFFEKNGMSLKATNEEEVIEKLEQLLTNKKLQSEMIKNQKKIINQYSAKDLVDYIIKNFK